MISALIFMPWLLLAIFPIIFIMEGGERQLIWSLAIWLLLSLAWIIPIFTGIPMKNTEGQFHAYVTAVERSGAIYPVMKAYMKTELESSDESIACIDRNNDALIARLKESQRKKEKLILQYEGYWQFPIKECHGSTWMIIGIVNDNF